MLDDNWDLVSGADAHEIELLNYDSQVSVIQSAVKYRIHRHIHRGEPLCPKSHRLQELHRAGTLFLLDKPGSYRKTSVKIYDSNGNVTYIPPDYRQVESMMADFFAELSRKWETWSLPEAAAYCLWRINWIHPFKNGNGRSARAFAYVVLCLRAREILPGTTTVIDLIMADKAPYEAALRHADFTFSQTGEADLRPMKKYIEEFLVKQLEPVVAATLAAERGDNIVGNTGIFC